MATRRIYLDVFQGKNGQWYWHARAANGEVITASEAYTTKWSAKRGAQRTFPAGKLRAA